MKIKELKEKRAGIFAEMDRFRKEHDGREISAEERAAFDKMLDDIDKIDQDISREERYLAIEKTLVQDKPAEDRSKKNPDQEARAVMFQVLRDGMKSLTPEQRTAITGVDGQAIMPTLIANTVEAAMKATGGMLEVATYIDTLTGGEFIVPSIDDTAVKAQIVAQYAKSENTEKTFDAVTFGAYTYRTGIIPIALELLQDVNFNLEQLFTNLMSQQFARGMNEHFTVGTGVSQPKGIVTAAHEVQAAAATLDLDDLLTLQKGIDSAYDKNAKYMFNKKTMIDMMKIKDQNKQYILNVGVNGMPPMLMGKEFVINNDLADIATTAVPIIYGDFSKYCIRRVKGITYTVLRERLAEYNSIGMMGYARVDGNLLDAGTHPVAKLKMA